MLTAPNGFIDTLRFGTFIVLARLTVWQNGQPTQYVVPVSECDITVSRTAAQRRSGTITAELLATVPPQPAMPVSPASPLSPFGNEVFIELALQTPTVPASAWVPLGLFVIATSQVADSTVDVVVTLTVYDRSWVISQRSFKTPYNVPAAGGNFDDEITHLVTQVWGTTPPIQFNIVPTTAVVPTASYNEGDSPWQAVTDMATAVGYEVYFDANGILVAKPVPDPTGQPAVFDYGPNAVTAQGTLTHPIGSTPYTTPTAVVSTMTREGVFNDVVVSGTGTQNAAGSTSGSTAPVRAEAQDTNPTSSTYVSGPVGDIPEFVQTPLATTVATAQAMANNELMAALSQAWTIEVTVPLNPLMEVDDVITVTDPRLGLNGVRVVLDTVEFGVRYDAATILTGRVVS